MLGLDETISSTPSNEISGSPKVTQTTYCRRSLSLKHVCFQTEEYMDKASKPPNENPAREHVAFEHNY